MLQGRMGGCDEYFPHFNVPAPRRYCRPEGLAYAQVQCTSHC